MERTNAVRASLPQQVDLVVVDLGWTTQRRLIPVARSWLAPAAKGIITLIKPHYECKELGVELPRGAILPEEQALDITQRVIAELTRDYQLTLKALTLSPLKGGATKSADTTKTKGTGNHEWLAWLTP
jgi:predicted rRNA methylase YqxC with S4 and FtsJ domains